MEESEHLYKLYGYGLCKGIPIPKTAENKVQDSSILGNLQQQIPQTWFKLWKALGA